MQINKERLHRISCAVTITAVVMSQVYQSCECHRRYRELKEEINQNQQMIVLITASEILQDHLPDNFLEDFLQKRGFSKEG